MKLRVLMDRSGAYVCLDNSLVCSHLPSLMSRIQKAMERGDALHPVTDRRKYAAYDESPTSATLSFRLADGRVMEIEVRETQKSVILS